LSATVLNVESGTTLAEIELRDHAARMDRVADSLAVRVLRELGRTRPIGLVRGTPLGSASLPALKAFLQGEQFLRRSQWDSAIVYDQHAIALDSGFALAWSHAGLAAGWAHSASDTFSLTYKLRAGSLNHGLAPRESLIVQAESLGAAVYGGADQIGGRMWTYARRMLATLTEAVRRYPTDPELWYMLGDAAFHAGPLARFGRQQSLDAFDRSIALDSAFTPSYVHAIQLALELRGPEAARRYAADYLRAGAAGNYATSTELMRRLLDPHHARSDATARLIDTMPMSAEHLAFSPIVAWPDSAETGIWFARRHRDRMLREGTDSDFADPELSQALAFRGHLQEAYRSGARGNNALFAQLALLGSVPPDTAEAVFRSWIGWKSGSKTRLWWALPWWADRHDTSAIAKVERWVETGLRNPPVPIPPMGMEVLGYLAQSSRAYFALAGGDSTAALRLFDALPDTACFGLCDLDALVRIKLLAARGRYQDAARRLEATPGLSWPGSATSPTRILWELERGRVHERLGNRDTARGGYAFVTAAWARADSALQPYVAEARAGLGRLSSESKR
jgi:serine/threonine-protein kinase